MIERSVYDWVYKTLRDHKEGKVVARYVKDPHKRQIAVFVENEGFLITVERFPAENPPGSHEDAHDPL